MSSSEEETRNIPIGYEDEEEEDEISDSLFKRDEEEPPMVPDTEYIIPPNDVGEIEKEEPNIEPENENEGAEIIPIEKELSPPKEELLAAIEIEEPPKRSPKKFEFPADEETKESIAEDLGIKLPPITHNTHSKIPINFNFKNTPFIVEISVSQPTKNKGHHEYLVKGNDDEGEIEIFRRYKEFLSLRQALLHAWPGIYIPPIPPKKLWGNKKGGFVQERMIFLNQFCQNLTHYPFLFFSQEVKLFLRSDREYAQTMKTFPKPKPEEILVKYGNEFHIDTNSIDTETIEEPKELIESLDSLPPVIALLKQLLKSAEDNRKSYTVVSNLYGQISNQLTQYETLNIFSYANQKEEKLVLSKPPNDSTLQSLILATMELQTPYMAIDIWTKQELYEVRAYKEAILSLISYCKERDKLLSKLTTAQNTLIKLQKGGTTMKTIWSSKRKETEIGALELALPDMEKELRCMTAIINVSTSFLRDVFLDDYKERQLDIYYELLREFGKGQIDYAQKMVESWTDILGDNNLSSKIN